jgi:branched-chain amino acid transport system substrate-binding protein
LNEGVRGRPKIRLIVFGNFWRFGALALPAFLLAACVGMGNSTQGDFTAAAPVSPVETRPLNGPMAGPAPVATVAPSGDQIGTGSVHLALILPLTQNGGPSVVGTSLRNAAELALSENGASDITIFVKDDHSSPDGARTAAQSAIDEGDELILGPLFSPNTREVGRLAQNAHKPVIAFSTDTTAAGPGVYLLSFLVENYVDRIVDYAATKGKKSVGALIPDNDYGRVAEAEFQQVAARRGLRVLEIEHYQAGSVAGAVKKIAAVGAQIDCLFIPEQADGMAAMAQALTAAGLDSKRVQILGTGVWNDARVLNLAPLQGAWFSAPDNTGFNAFAARYRAKFNTDPTRIATLSYDAVSLAVALAKTRGAQRYTENAITNRAGFNGADGVFRFRGDGQNERGLGVYQINNGAAQLVSPAPRSLASTAAN